MPAGPAEVSAADRERNRVAWNLPRQPGPYATANVGVTREPVLATAAEDRDTAQRLDWYGFLSKYFPGRRRHDLEALTAYGDYRSSRPVAEPSAHLPDRSEGASHARH
jgi:hypothetical protein